MQQKRLKETKRPEKAGQCKKRLNKRTKKAKNKEEGQKMLQNMLKEPKRPENAKTC